MHPKTISGPFKRRRNAFHEKIKGLIFGIAIGDALGLPFRDIPPGGALKFEDTAIDYIDKVYFPDVGFRDEWPDVTSLALGTSRALIEIHEHDKPLRDTLHSQFMRTAFFKHTSSPTKQMNIKIDGPVHFDGRQTSLFTLLAPIAPFSCQCRLNTYQTINLSVRIAKLYTDSLFNIFPAIELVLLLKSIFFGSEVIPDVCAPIKEWAIKKRFQKDFKAYLELRNEEPAKIPKATDIYIWRTVEEAIMGLAPGEQWANVQAFESAVLKAVNNFCHRNLTAAIAGAILGANWGYPGIPRRFSENIRGDVFLFDLAQDFVDTFFVFSLAKQYNEKKTRKSLKSVTPTPDISKEPVLIFTAQEKINCMFFTVVVRNESLGAKYPGGVGAYAKKHGAICNDKIAVTCDMGGETDVVVADLEKNSLKFADDWACFDAAMKALELTILKSREDVQESIPVDLKIDWINAHFSPDTGFQVWYDKKDIQNPIVSKER